MYNMVIMAVHRTEHPIETYQALQRELHEVSKVESLLENKLELAFLSDQLKDLTRLIIIFVQMVRGLDISIPQNLDKQLELESDDIHDNTISGDNELSVIALYVQI